MQIKPLLIPIASLIFALGLGIGGVVFILGRTGPILEKINTLTFEQATLEAKVATLNQLSATAGAQSDLVSISLPPTNSTAVVVAQVKSLASQHSVVLVNVNASSEESAESDINNSNIEIKAQGSYDSLEAFLKNLANIIPLVNIDDLKITTAIGGEYELRASLRSYWSLAPSTLPGISEAVDNLTDDEINLLNRLSEFKKPEFEQLQPQSATDSGRISPFVIGG